VTREELLEERNTLHRLVKQREALGEFDTNAATILAGLKSQLRVVQHLIDRSRRSKD
jgi:hypothetical protein